MEKNDLKVMICPSCNNVLRYDPKYNRMHCTNCGFQDEVDSIIVKKKIKRDELILGVLMTFYLIVFFVFLLDFTIFYGICGCLSLRDP